MPVPKQLPPPARLPHSGPLSDGGALRESAATDALSTGRTTQGARYNTPTDMTTTHRRSDVKRIGRLSVR
jgi:hypothetical protein